MMNISIYIFKRFKSSSGYKVSSFPNNLDKFAEKAITDIEVSDTNSCKIIVLRKGNLVYYLYTVKIGPDLLGFGFIINNAYLTEIGSLYRYCTDLIATMGCRNLLITWSKTDGLVFTSKNFADCREEAQKVMSRLEELRDNSIFSKAISLPPLDYSSSGNTSILDCSQGGGVIPESMRQIDSLEILLPSPSYSVYTVLDELNKVAELWKKQYTELSHRFTSLNRQKKRMKWVVILVLCLVAGGFILLNVNKNLNRTKSDLTEANGTINGLNSEIDSLSTVNNKYLAEIYVLKDSYEDAVDRIYKYESRSPIVIGGMSISYRQGDSSYSGIPAPDAASHIFFEVDYTSNRYSPVDFSKIPYPSEANTEIAPSEQERRVITLDFRCYYREHDNKSSFIFRNSQIGSFDIDNIKSPSGKFTTPDFNMGFKTFPAGKYRVELWDIRNNICIGYKEFSI